MSSKMFKFSLLTTLIAAILHVQLVSAQDFSSSPLCKEGEFVVSMQNVAALRHKAVDVLQDVSSKVLTLSESTERELLISDLDNSSDQQVRLRAADDICRDYRAYKRSVLRANNKLGVQTPIRRIVCSCNGIFKANAWTPNDQYLWAEWGLAQANDIDMDVNDAWGIHNNASNVMVAVIDSGVKATHPDLVAAIYVNSGEIADNGIDDDGNGYVDDISGYNATGSSTRPLDDNGHGTHVAGTIGATTNNSIGVAGVAPGVKILPVKFLDASGSGSLYDAIKAVDYVTNMKTRKNLPIVLSNNSWGGGGSYGPLYDAINRARNADILFVAAAGNESNNNDTNPSYPASYLIDNVISVAAVDRNGNLASFSNYGATRVHVGAPGVEIASTYINASPSDYVYLSGTSMASPNVSGTIALTKAYRPALTMAQLKNIVLTTGNNLSSLAGKTTTGKMVNLYNMLVAAANTVGGGGGVGSPTPTPTATPAPTPTPSPTPAPTPTPTPTSTPIPTPTPKQYRSISGTSNPGSKITFVTNTGTQYQFASPEGTFTFTNIEVGSQITMSASLTGYTFSAPYTTTVPVDPNWAVHIGGWLHSVTIRMHVVDTDGNPIYGVNVSPGGKTDSNGDAIFDVEYDTDYSSKLDDPRYFAAQGTLTGHAYGETTRTLVVTPLEELE